MEVGAEGGHNLNSGWSLRASWAEWVGRRSSQTARGRRIRGAIGIDVEGSIFFNGPPVVGDLGDLVRAIHNLYRKTAACKEVEGHGHTRAERAI